jgi:hypothetical protein
MARSRGGPRFPLHQAGDATSVSGSPTR